MVGQNIDPQFEEICLAVVVLRKYLQEKSRAFHKNDLIKQPKSYCSHKSLMVIPVQVEMHES